MEKKAVDKKRVEKNKATSSSSGVLEEDADRQPDVAMDETQIGDDEEAVEGIDSSADDVDPSIARLIQKTAKVVGKECEVRWEKRVSKLIKAEAAKTADRFSKER